VYTSCLESTILIPLALPLCTCIQQHIRVRCTHRRGILVVHSMSKLWKSLSTRSTSIALRFVRCGRCTSCEANLVRLDGDWRSHSSMVSTRPSIAWASLCRRSVCTLGASFRTLHLRDGLPVSGGLCGRQPALQRINAVCSLGLTRMIEGSRWSSFTMIRPNGCKRCLYSSSGCLPDHMNGWLFFGAGAGAVELKSMKENSISSVPSGCSSTISTMEAICARMPLTTPDQSRRNEHTWSSPELFCLPG